MADKEQMADEPEVIEITEEDVAAADGGRSWTEEFEMAGGEVMGFIKKIWREGNIRRIIIRNETGDTIINIPVSVGALGLIQPLFAPILALTAVGAIVALISKCKISVERVATEEEESEKEQTVAAA
ncbi:MAG: hypothetical protein ACI9EW_003742 [Cellvibrionaceae bacterium]|jgi:hypothetical protein